MNKEIFQLLADLLKDAGPPQEMSSERLTLEVCSFVNTFTTTRLPMPETTPDQAQVLRWMRDAAEELEKRTRAIRGAT